MPRVKNLQLPNPLGGIVRRYAHDGTPPEFTQSALNCTGSDWSVAQDGRDRISTRPSLEHTDANIGVPRAWADANWTNSGAQRGIIVACNNGLWRTQNGGTWTELITDSASSDFASCAAFLGAAYFARGGQTCLFRALTDASGAGSALTNSGGGTAPTNCGLVCAHQDRLVLAGDTSASQTVYFSGTGDPTEWDYADTDLGAAIPVALSVPEPVTALISHTRDCLIIGCTDSVMVFRGNPAGGQLERVGHYFGPLGPAAWTHDGSGALWYISRDGLMRMSAGCGDFSQSISRESLPDELVAINPGTASTYVSLSFDPRFRCLWLLVDHPGSDPADAFWSFDLQSPQGSWWKHSFDDGPMRLGATLKSSSTEDLSSGLLLNASGAVYQLNADGAEDYDAHVIYGPYKTGSSGFEGILHGLQASLATGSDDLEWELYGGQTGQAAVDAAIAASAPLVTGVSWAAGLNTWQYPHRKNAFVCLRMFTSGFERWSIESIDAVMHSAGKRLTR